MPHFCCRYPTASTSHIVLPRESENNQAFFLMFLRQTYRPAHTIVPPNNSVVLRQVAAFWQRVDTTASEIGKAATISRMAAPIEPINIAVRDAANRPHRHENEAM